MWNWLIFTDFLLFGGYLSGHFASVFFPVSPRRKCRIIFIMSSISEKQMKIQFMWYAQKCHMHINSTCHFFKITFMSILNIISKYGHINIALLHDKISNKCHNIPSIGSLACFIGTFSLINTNRF